MVAPLHGVEGATVPGRAEAFKGSRRIGLVRICLVTPFAWSQPHAVNDHVAGAADELRRRGHEVVVLAPSSRATELAAGRRALKRLGRAGEPLEGVVALGPAVPVSRRSSLGVPIGVRANLELALTRDRFDIVHVHEPGLPSLSYLALRDTRALAVATFHSAERLGYPPGKKQREKLLGRVDALTATSRATAAAAAARFPGDYRMLPLGVDLERVRPGRARKRFVLEWKAEEVPRLRAVFRALTQLPGWQLVVLRTTSLAGRPYVPRALRSRVSVRTALDEDARAAELAGAAGFVPSPRGSARLALEARAAGVPQVDPPGVAEQPQLVGAALARLAEDADWREQSSSKARRSAEPESFGRLGDELERLYGSVLRKRRAQAAPVADPLADRPMILADLHMHTEHSHDCAVPVEDLLEHAERIGLGAIAVTDHNVFSGAEEAVELARARDLVVIPGEEVKTDAGEVIGLFIHEEIQRGLSMGDTIAAIREQGGIVYLPHPFDRLHTIPDPRTLHRHLAEIDVFEVYNARLLLEGMNEEALRFARKYNLTMGAGSDAHVLQGVGTGLVRLRAFETPEEFLISLRSAEIVRRPKSLLYLQGLKWVAQARERRTKASVR
jgi:predicted metal-dependent phosphoesterase TrpH/glycosyltransferase involved in cell wall biosynthesis